MKKTLFIAALAFMTSCQNPKTTPAIDLSNFDTTISPSEDFYEYATAGWQRKNPLKAESARYGTFDVLRDNNETRINELFASMTSAAPAPGSVEQKIVDLYRMGLDSVRLNAEGAAPIAAEVQRLLSLERTDLTAVIGEMHAATANPFFSVDVDSDLSDSNRNTLYAAQPHLLIGNRDYYVDEENAHLVEAYRHYLAEIFTLAGVDAEEAATAADAVVAFEKALAEKNWSSVQMRDIQALNNPMSRADFERRYDAIDWPTYYAALQIEDFSSLIVLTPSALDNVNALLKTTPIETLRYYMAAHYINSAARYLSDDFQTTAFEFYDRTLSGKQEQRPRWKRAMEIPNGVLSEAVGKMYVAKYFSEADKERMLGIVKNLQQALSQHIDALDWMSDATKVRAQEKLATFTVKIGYPDTWESYDGLEIDPEKSYWENVVAASKWHTADAIAKLNKPVDRAKWLMSPQTVNAYYNPATNEICFPAAILQPPFYNSAADDAVNYGAIGVVIGHEMTHGFDDQGRNYDKDGNVSNWWTEEDAVAFKAKTDVLVKQFNAIEVLPAKGDQPAIYADGSLSLGENIADQGGLRVAWTAYQNSLEGKETPAPIDGFTDAQRFYLGYATLWAQNIRDEEIARRTKMDVHSLGKWRVNATVRNLQTFYDAFNITEGAMFLPAEERIIIW